MSKTAGGRKGEFPKRRKKIFGDRASQCMEKTYLGGRGIGGPEEDSKQEKKGALKSSPKL